MFRSGRQVDSKGFELSLRGCVRLYRNGADCTPKSRKGRALLAILAAEQRPLTRVRIIDLLWSDRQEEQGRASLRTLLADLRSQFNSQFDELLTVNREEISLGPSVRTDLADPGAPRRAGEWFDGLDHIDPELDDWLRFERERRAGEPQLVQLASAAHPATQHARRQAWLLPLALVLVLLLAGALYIRL